MGTLAASLFDGDFGGHRRSHLVHDAPSEERHVWNFSGKLSSLADRHALSSLPPTMRPKKTMTDHAYQENYDGPCLSSDGVTSSNGNSDDGSAAGTGLSPRSHPAPLTASTMR